MFEVCPNEHLKKTKWMSNGIDPLGIRSIIYKIYNRYALPIIITENGMAYSDVLENNRVHDTYRIEYLSAHIKEVLRAKEEGYPVLDIVHGRLLMLLVHTKVFQKDMV